MSQRHRLMMLLGGAAAGFIVGTQLSGPLAWVCLIGGFLVLMVMTWTTYRTKVPCPVCGAPLLLRKGPAGLVRHLADNHDLRMVGLAPAPKCKPEPQQWTEDQL